MNQYGLKEIQIYFINDDPPIIQEITNIKALKIKDGFIKILDYTDNEWHCYNLSAIKHFHYPDHTFDFRTGYKIKKGIADCQ